MKKTIEIPTNLKSKLELIRAREGYPSLDSEDLLKIAFDTLDPNPKYVGEQNVILLPPGNESPDAVPYEKKKRIRNKVRDWALTYEKQSKQDMYAWDLIAFIVDSLNIPQPIKRVGRPSANISDQLKFAILKIYNKQSFRRQFSFNFIYSNSGYTKKLLKRTSINKVFIDPQYTKYLERIYRNLADFMVPFENSFAVDSTGFSNRYNSRWVQVRLEFQKHKAYNKLHIICGTHTKIIAEVRITKGQAADSPLFKELLGGIVPRFRIKRICADAGYLSRPNVQAVSDLMAIPFIMPKKGCRPLSRGYPAWHKMMYMFQNHFASFLKNYHLRSSVENVFSMMKTNLLDGISSKTEVSQNNELLIRVICHNISVVIDAVFGLGLDPYLAKPRPKRPF